MKNDYFRTILNDLNVNLFKAKQNDETSLQSKLDAWIANSEDEIEIRFESIKIYIDNIAKKIERSYNRSLNLRQQSTINEIVSYGSGFKTRGTLEYFLLVAHVYQKKISTIEASYLNCRQLTIQNNNIGNFKNYFKYSKIELIDEISVDWRESIRIINFHEKILVLQLYQATISVYDQYFNLVTKIYLDDLNWRPNKYIRMAITMCVNNLGDLIVFDEQTNEYGSLWVIDKNSVYYEPIPCDHCIDYMKTDNENPYLLYSANETVVNVFDILSAKTLTTLNIAHTNEIHVTDEKLFIAGTVTYRTLYGDYEFIPRNETCISIVNKKTFELLNKIEFKNLSLSKRVYFDEYENIWSVAYKIDQFKQQSEFTYLFASNSNGDVIQEIYLNNIETCFDFIVINDKLFLFAGNCIQVLQLS